MTFAYKWGSPQGDFSNPIGTALDGAGNVYVVEQGANRLQVFTPAGAFLRSWVGLNFPRGIAIDRGLGEVYVVNEGGNTLQVYSLMGTLLRTMTGFNAPMQVALDGLGNMYVSNFNTHQVLKYTTGSGNTPGVLVGSLGNGQGNLDGQMNGPTAVAVGPDGNVYVGELNNNRISVFQPDGTFLRKFGEPGGGDGQFNRIRYMEFDGQGRLWEVETGNQRVQVLDAYGNFLGKFGTLGSADGQLNEPNGLAMNPAGQVWVAEWGNNRVSVFAPCGTVPTPTPTVTAQATICETFAYKWGNQGNLSRPIAVALDGDGNVYVVEQEGTNRLQVFTSTGTFLRSWGGLNLPRGIAIDRGLGEVYVVNEAGNNVQVYSLTGTLLRTMTGFDAPMQVALDGLGNMYVSNFNTHRVLKYTTGSGNTPGVLVGSLGNGQGNFDGQMNGPTAVAVGPGGNLYVGEFNNNRISVFQPDGTFLRKFGVGGGGDGQFNEIRYLEFDGQGRLWEVETGNQRVQVLDAYGNFLGKLVATSSGPLNEPNGLAVNSAGQVWVAEWGNNRVCIFLSCAFQVPTPQPTPIPEALALRVDVASPMDTNDQEDNLWLADKAYPAYYGYTQGGSVATTLEAVAGTQDDVLYQTYRHGTALEYRFDLPTGNYTIDLKFADFTSTAVGQNVFNVSAGTATAPGVDIFARAGHATASDLGLQTSVTAGVPLVIRLEAVTGEASLSAIRVAGLQPNPNPLIIYLLKPGGGAFVP